MSDNRPWIVQKFGGTSVGKFPVKIAGEIVTEWEKVARTVVVCSARSNNIKAQGTTTCLLRAADFALSGRDFRQVLEGIRDDHLTGARAAIPESKRDILEDLETSINNECTHVNQILEASNILDEVSPRTLDLVLSAGERLACLFMVAVIKSLGHRAALVDLTRVLEGTPGATPRVGAPSERQTSTPPKSENGEVIDYADLTEKITTSLKQASADGSIPVVTGFFGLVSGGLLNSVGRGYTDLCAALCAVGLHAKELQIWKEVDGIFTADPRKVPTARLLDQITPEEAAELTYYGSEVIHPFTMSQVIEAHIPIRIKNVMKPLGKGTKVFPIEAGNMVDNAAAAESLGLELGPTAITSKGGIVVLNIISNRTRQSHGFLAQIFKVLDKYRLVVDLISTSEVHVSMAIHESSLEGALDSPLASAVRDIRMYGSVTVKEKMSIVSLVGTKMKQYVGIAAQMFSTLADAGVNIDMISQGSSEINISCVINASEVLNAISVLHAKLLSHAYTPTPEATPEPSVSKR